MIYDRPDYQRPTTTKHTVVYIEYFEGVPHEAQTVTEGGHTESWDIDPYGGDIQDLMIYNPGSGFDWEIDIHAISPESKCEVWINPDYRQRITIKQLINAQIIDQPYEHTHGFTRSTNPFEYCREVGSIEYCSACEMHYNEDYCPKHDCEFTEGAEEEWQSRNHDEEE